MVFLLPPCCCCERWTGREGRGEKRSPTGGMAASGERELAAALMASANLGVYSFGFLSGDDRVMRGFNCLVVEV